MKGTGIPKRKSKEPKKWVHSNTISFPGNTSFSSPPKTIPPLTPTPFPRIPLCLHPMIQASIFHPSHFSQFDLLSLYPSLYVIITI